MKRIIYIENNSTEPQYNLAFEEYVFCSISPACPILLLWQNEPSVIVGKYQNTLEEINYDFVRENGIHVVRRNTGGGAVYHDMGNLNFSFIIPDAGTKIDFKTFSIPVVKALKSQGIPAEQTGRNDILVKGMKCSGNAQQFSDHKLLHHGTMMYDVDMDSVAGSLNVKAGKFRSKASKSVRSRVTNLKPFFPEDMNVGRFKKLILDWFRAEYAVDTVVLNDSQLSEIDFLRKTKYDTYEWNFGKSPAADIVRGDFFRCGYVEFNFRIKKHRIQSVKLVGDFFSSLPIEDFEAMFVDIRYDRESILSVLRSADLSSYLGDVTPEELTDVIV